MQARKLAKPHGPGNVPKKESTYRVRIDMVKVDQFLEFTNRPYFYQDVAYGSRKLSLDTGEKISRSTMVQHYQFHSFESLYSY